MCRSVAGGEGCVSVRAVVCAHAGGPARMFAVQRRGSLGCGSRFLRAPSPRRALLCSGRERNGSAFREEAAVLAGVVWVR